MTDAKKLKLEQPVKGERMVAIQLHLSKAELEKLRKTQLALEIFQRASVIRAAINKFCDNVLADSPVSEDGRGLK